MDRKLIKERFGSGYYDDKLRCLYGHENKPDRQTERYLGAISKFGELYPQRDDIHIYSAPGRTEICGNHTDHQHGCVLAAAVGLDAVAVAAFHNEDVIRLSSEGYPMCTVDLNDLEARENEKGTTAALVKGVLSRFKQLGLKIGGFDAYVTSDVISGSGLSSSAAFEILIGTMINKHYNKDKANAAEIAKIGQYAENEYFGKKSGLMDQLVSSVGGAVFIDFENTNAPEISRLSYDLGESGYAVCITDTKGSHADLTDDYTAVPTEMCDVAAKLGKSFLRETDEEDFYDRLPQLRAVCSDRAILRAAHFLSENRRAREAAKALEENDIRRFLEIIRRSGDSSAKWLQNLYSCRAPEQQGITLALMLSERILGGKGAARVHGGGFAGTIQAFVPQDTVTEYSSQIDRIFGMGSCHVLRIRPVGGIEITEEEL